MKITKLFTKVSFVLLVGCFAVGLTASPAQAATYCVDDTDEGDGTAAHCTADEACGAGGNDCGIADALAATNADCNLDTIIFDPATFPPGSGTTISTTSALDVEGGVTITGPGTDSLTIDNDGSSRVFVIDHMLCIVTAGPHEISNMTITGGAGGIDVDHIEDSVTLDTLVIMDNTAATDEGAGVQVGSLTGFTTVTIKDCTITGNVTTADGGGVATLTGTTAIENSTISGNSSADGGGVHNDTATTTITNSTISGNSALDEGGGLNNEGGGSMTVTNSTISDNDGARGGGIRNDDADTSLDITNSTISGNMATGDGGGISHDNANNSTVTLLNVTITENTADVDANDIGDGGGISTQGVAQTNTTTLTNTIVAGNTDASTGAEAPDCHDEHGTTTHTLSVGNNLIGDVKGCGTVHDFDDVAKNDQFGDSTGAGALDPLLGPLVAQSPAAHTPMDGSPAIDAVDDNIAAVPADDQRGTTRPQGAAADIGAIETTCGDGEIQGSEECDDGSANSDVDADACRTTCQVAFCSDGVVDTGEECDDGNLDDGDGCDSTCMDEGGTGTGTGTGTGGGTGDGGGCSLIRR